MSVARVLHSKMLCCALGHEPSLPMFHCFFRLAKNENWLTLEKSQVEKALISSTILSLGTWKDLFFWISKSVVPFKMVWRKLDVVLNDKEPYEDVLDRYLLLKLHSFSSKFRPFPETLFISLGMSVKWEIPNLDSKLFVIGEGTLASRLICIFA